MLLDSLGNPGKNLFWTSFHIILAGICTLNPVPFIVWFYLILFSALPKVISQLQRGVYFSFISLLCYLVSFEMLGRMTKVAPFIPTELGKYFLIFFSLLGILITGIRSYTALLLVLLLLPSLTFDLSGERAYFDIVYNIFGPLGLALGISVLYKVKVTSDNMVQLLKLLWFTSLSVLIFTFIKTPDLDSINFNLRAEFETTADTSSNQVATILGLGMFLSFYSVINRKKFSGFYYVDIAIMLLFAFQGLLSFSRGGMIIAGLGMLTLLFFRSKNRIKVSKSRIFITSIIALLGLYLVFTIVDNITGGNLTLRYRGETEGTLGGYKEKSADVFVSGRLTILEEDFNLWLQNPILGVGAASSRYLRDRTYLVSPHIEFSRLLAEHGFLGLIYFVILLLLFYKSYRKLSPHSFRNISLALFLIAILTTFHAAMRTYISPLLCIMSVLYVLPDPVIKSTR